MLSPILLGRLTMNPNLLRYYSFVNCGILQYLKSKLEFKAVRFLSHGLIGYTYKLVKFVVEP